jgi:hypothetical protein
MYINDNRGSLPSASRAQGDLGSDYVTNGGDVIFMDKTGTWVDFSLRDLWNHKYISSRKIAICPAFDSGIASQYSYWYGWANGTGEVSSATGGGRMTYLYLNLMVVEFLYYNVYSNIAINGQYSLRLTSRWNYAGKQYSTSDIALFQDTVAWPYTETPPGGYVPPFTAHGTNVKQQGGNILKGDWSVRWVPFAPTRYQFLPSGYYNYIDHSD